MDPDPSQGSIIANSSMDLLCIDFMKANLSKDEKKNVLVMKMHSLNLVWQL